MTGFDMAAVIEAAVASGLSRVTRPPSPSKPRTGNYAAISLPLFSTAPEGVASTSLPPRHGYQDPVRPPTFYIPRARGPGLMAFGAAAGDGDQQPKTTQP